MKNEQGDRLDCLSSVSAISGWEWVFDNWTVLEQRVLAENSQLGLFFPRRGSHRAKSAATGTSHRVCVDCCRKDASGFSDAPTNYTDPSGFQTEPQCNQKQDNTAQQKKELTNQEWLAQVANTLSLNPQSNGLLFDFRSKKGQFAVIKDPESALAAGHAPENNLIILNRSHPDNMTPNKAANSLFFELLRHATYKSSGQEQLEKDAKRGNVLPEDYALRAEKISFSLVTMARRIVGDNRPKTIKVDGVDVENKVWEGAADAWKGKEFDDFDAFLKVQKDSGHYYAQVVRGRDLRNGDGK